jgi:hypothetical protein
MSQEDFMKKDECILCNEDDVVTGSCSKYDSHVFSIEYVSLSFMNGFEFNNTYLSLEVSCIALFRFSSSIQRVNFYSNSELRAK